MKDQVLTVQRMQHLESLGVDVSKGSVYWARRVHGSHMEDESKGEWFLSLHKCFMTTGFTSYEVIPTFTLEDMLEMMPKTLYCCVGDYAEISLNAVRYGSEYDLGLIRIYNGYMIEYADFDGDSHLTNETGKTALEAAYKMLCWLAERNLLGKEEEK